MVMYAFTKFQLIWRTSDFGIKFAQKNTSDKNFEKYHTLPHVFRLFFPVNEGWMHSVNTSSFVLLFSNFHGQERVQHLYLRTSCLF